MYTVYIVPCSLQQIPATITLSTLHHVIYHNDILWIVLMNTGYSFPGDVESVVAGFAVEDFDPLNQR